MRPVTIETGVSRFAEGSALIAFGSTSVWCTASVEERVPPFLEGKRRGWVTGEYAMLPRATNTRVSWDRSINSGRSQEISRLIGRSLRAAIDMKRLGERTITIDCVVQQADGGTRTAAITGGFVALALACDRLVATQKLKSSPILLPVAAVSVGVVANEVRLDLDYSEDSGAQADCNIVMNSRGNLIEIQGTGEQRAFTRDELERMLEIASPAIDQLVAAQRTAIENAAARV
jgi:ribonuclease PH